MAWSNRDEVKITIPDEKERSDFIKRENMLLESALMEDKNRRRKAEAKRAKPLIQRVPSVLSDIKEDFQKLFEPRLVALGPVHHGDEKFKRAEETKQKLAALFADENGTTGIALFDRVKEEIEQLKKCYDPDIIEKYDDDQLAWMFFLDGSAVLYAIHYGLQRKFKELNVKADLLVVAQMDLFLLENQLPYRVLQILIDSSKNPQQWKDSITKFIADNLMTNIESGQQSQPKEGQEDGRESGQQSQQKEERDDYAHLLEHLREKHLLGLKEDCSRSPIGEMLLWFGDSRKHWKTFRSIKELKESGISVKPSKSYNLRNISFYCNFLGSLKMPRLLVDDSTASKLLNLIALEMCRDYDNDFAITSYLYFLDSLIDTAEDVRELRVTGMLHNYLGSDQEVADLFNKMSRDLVPDLDVYRDVTEQIHKYCNNPLTDTVARVYYTHFSSTWTLFAFFTAMIYLIFSAVSAYFAAFPPKRSD